jgi:hypothetical protein
VPVVARLSPVEAVRPALPLQKATEKRDIDKMNTSGSVGVEVVVGKQTHFRSPVEPKRSVLILSRSWPDAPRRSVAFSTNDVGPQT